MKGRLCIVTGGTTGIGLATCEGLMARGADVIMTGRNMERAEAQAEVLRARHSEGSVQTRPLDLARLDSVRQFAAELEAREIHVLIHNAGVIYPKRQSTPEGFDAQLSVIYLGPFLLTHLLLDKLKRGAPSRIINVASDLHRRVKMNWDDLQSERRYNCLNSYSQGELAKVLYTYELARRVRGTGVTANSLHPGGVRTQLFRNFRPPMSWLIWLSNWFKVGPAKGARTSLYLACSDEVEEASGGYYVGCKPRRSSKVSYREEDGARLWELTEKMVGLK